ncbi:MAG: hypothetical protein GEU26_00260 [Nitrososphaeraceae archaeon]|nr:hypothetical protein [Nitrososphaeraceae archaeon]
MNWEETKSIKEPELVTVNGLQFKKYQMSWLRDMAIRYNHGSVNEFIIDVVLTDLLIKLEKLYGNNACRYPYPIREKLKEEGYEGNLEKIFKLTGAPGEVVLDNIEEIT